MLEPTGPHGTHLLQTGHQVSIRDPICHTRGGSVHVFKANSLSHMFLVMACNSHPAWLFLLAVASLTETCMFSMIWALTFCMSPYMSGFDHTRAAIPCTFGKVQGRFLEMCCCRRLQIPRSRFPLDLPGVHALSTVSAMCCEFKTCSEGSQHCHALFPVFQNHSISHVGSLYTFMPREQSNILLSNISQSQKCLSNNIGCCFGCDPEFECVMRET